MKDKKDLENENRLENIKELLSAMKEFDNLEDFLEHVSLATSIDQQWEGENKFDDYARIKVGNLMLYFYLVGKKACFRIEIDR